MDQEYPEAIKEQLIRLGRILDANKKMRFGTGGQ